MFALSHLSTNHLPINIVSQIVSYLPNGKQQSMWFSNKQIHSIFKLDYQRWLDNSFKDIKYPLLYPYMWEALTYKYVISTVNCIDIQSEIDAKKLKKQQELSDANLKKAFLLRKGSHIPCEYCSSIIPIETEVCGSCLKQRGYRHCAMYHSLENNVCFVCGKTLFISKYQK